MGTYSSKVILMQGITYSITDEYVTGEHGQMKTLVIYRSKTGFSKAYAEWIAHVLEADLREYRSVHPHQFVAYDTIVYGGGLYAVGINGIDLIKNNLDALKDKRVIVFATGATPARAETTAQIRNMNFTLEQQRRIQFFYLRGGFNYKKLALTDKILMNLLKLRLKRKKELNPDERGMLAAFAQPIDFTKEQNLAPLLLSLGI